jgi:ankyrin repeat protein
MAFEVMNETSMQLLRHVTENVVDASGPDGVAAMRKACVVSSAAVTWLLQRGCDPNVTMDAISDIPGMTALHLAIVRGTMHTVAALVMGGADINRRVCAGPETRPLSPVSLLASVRRPAHSARDDMFKFVILVTHPGVHLGDDEAAYVLQGTAAMQGLFADARRWATRYRGARRLWIRGLASWVNPARTMTR